MTRATCSRLAARMVPALICLISFLCAHRAGADGGNWRPLTQLAGGMPVRVTVQGHHAYVAAQSAVVVLDVSDPSSPRPVGYCDTPGWAWAAALAGDYLYVPASLDGLRVLRISDPSHPIEVGSCEIRGQCQGARVRGGIAYVAAGDGGLVLVDVSSPTSPVELGAYELGHRARDVEVAQGYVLVAGDGCGLTVVDVSDPRSPAKIGHCGTWWGTGVALSGGYAYLAASEEGLVVIDLSDIENPHQVGQLRTHNIARTVAVAGTCAYIGDHEGGMTIADVSDPAHPRELGHLDIDGWTYGVAVAGRYAYCANSTGLRVVDVSNAEWPRVVGTFTTVGGACDVAVADGMLSVADYSIGLRLFDISSGDHAVEVGHFHMPFAHSVAAVDQHRYLLGKYAQVKLVDMSDPAQSRGLGEWQLQARLKGLAAAGRYGYVADDEAGLAMFDAVGGTPTVRYAGLPKPCSITGVAIDGAYAYLSDGMGRLHIGGVSRGGGRWRELGSCAISGSPRGVAVCGRYAYVASDGHGLVAVDVLNASQPAPVGYTPVAGQAVAVAGGYAYVASGEQGLKVVDVSDTRRPVEKAAWDTPGQAQSVAVSNGRVYVADRMWGVVVFPEGG